MKIRKLIAGLMTAVMLMCSVQVPAGAVYDDLFTVNDTIDGVVFRDLYDFARYFTTHKAGDAEVKKYDALKAWFAENRDWLYILNTDNSLHVTLTPTYIGVWYMEKEDGEVVELFDYYGTAGKTAYTAAKKRYRKEAGKEDSTAKMFTTSEGFKVYFDGSGANEYRYYWKQYDEIRVPSSDSEKVEWLSGDRYFVLRVFRPEKKPEDYMKLHSRAAFFRPAVLLPEMPANALDKLDSGLKKLLRTAADDDIIPVMIYRDISDKATVLSDREFVEKYISKDRAVNVYERIPGMIYAKLTAGEIRSLMTSPDVGNIDYFEEFELSNDDDTQLIADEDGNVLLKLIGSVAYDTDGNKYNGWWPSTDSKERYYKDGQRVVKSCVIDGIFYRFKDGVCKGKYTGFAKVSKGTVYYKNGVRVKNKTLRTKDGTRFKADRNGILTEIA